MAGTSLELPSAALRAADLRLLGSGQGSLGLATIVAELPALAEAINTGKVSVEPLPTPLSEVESAWERPAPAGARVVFEI